MNTTNLVSEIIEHVENCTVEDLITAYNLIFGKEITVDDLEDGIDADVSDRLERFFNERS